MLQKSPSSIRLLPPRERDELTPPFSLLAELLLSQALFLGFGGCLVTMLALPVHGWVLALTGLVVPIALALLSERPRELFGGFAGGVVLSLLLWALAYRHTRAGLALLSNAVTRLLSVKNLQIMAQYEVSLPEASHALAVTLFLLPPALLLSLLCALCARSNLAVAPIGLLLFQLGAMLGLESFAGAQWLLLLFLALCLMLCRTNSPRRQTNALFPPFAALLAALLVIGLFPGASDTLSGRFASQRDFFQRKSHASQYESAALPLPEGRLADMTGFSPSDETALTVAMEEPAAMYLRGFVGGAVGTGGWTALSKQTLYEEQALFYRLHRSGFYPQAQLAQLALATGYVEKEEASSLSLSIGGACRAFAYAPYELGGAPNSLLSPDGLDDSGLSGGVLQQYTLTVFPKLAAEYPTLSELLSWQSGNPSEALSSYLSSEERFRRFAYDAYTALDGDSRKVLAAQLSQGAVAGESHLSYADAKDAVRNLVARTMTYSADAPTAFDGTAESLARLLDGAGQGSSAQYATVAALVFRYYGIPSRYVEGYLVTGSDAKRMTPNEPYALTMKNAHAWVEYYHDGLGWIPFEVTPGYLEEIEAPEDTSQSDQATEPLPEPPPEDPPEEPQPPPAQNVLLWVWPPALLLLLVVLWLLARRLTLQRRHEAFLQSDTNRAASLITGQLLRLLSAEGLTPPEDSLSSLTQPLSAARGEGFAAKYQRAVDLAGKAAFSGKPLPAPERDEALAILEEFIADAETKKRAKRLYWRYALWLY